MILLYHDDTTDGMIATSAAKVAGEAHTPRHYRHNGHFVEIDGHLDHVLAHDAEEICKIPGYRLATPKEQADYQAQKRKATQITEDDNNADEGKTRRKDK
jgi:hypothetical protein